MKSEQAERLTIEQYWYAVEQYRAVQLSVTLCRCWRILMSVGSYAQRNTLPMLPVMKRVFGLETCQNEIGIEMLSVVFVLAFDSDAFWLVYRVFTTVAAPWHPALDAIRAAKCSITFICIIGQTKTCLPFDGCSLSAECQSWYCVLSNQWGRLAAISD